MSDAEDPPAGLPAAEREAEVRMERRRFFRAIADDAVRTAASLAGAAGALRATTQEMAGGLLSSTDAPAGTPAAAGAAGPSPAGLRGAFRLEGDRLILLDQRRLPDQLAEVACESAADVAQAIRDMVIRGAPALGQVAAAGLALAAHRAVDAKPYARRAILRGSANALVNAHPTAVSISWATNRMLARHAAVGELLDDGAAVAAALRAEAEAIIDQAAMDHAVLARRGADLVPHPEGRTLRLLTHGATGPLAGGQVGTALGVAMVLASDGRDVHVYVDETRPWLHGARLAAWELAQAGVPHTLLADAAAGWLIASGDVDAVLVGADRIAANGDTANTIGTYPLAVLAVRHGVPFLVFAPTATLDGATPDGSAIATEMLSPGEVTGFAGRRVAPAGTTALNPSFDITPAELITAIVTEAGVLRPPFRPAIGTTVAERESRHPAPMPRAAIERPPQLSSSPGPADAGGTKPLPTGEQAR